MSDSDRPEQAVGPSPGAEIRAEREFVDIGKDYSFSGEELVTFVRERMEKWRSTELARLEREERVEKRRQNVKQMELDNAAEQRKHDLELARLRKESNTTGSSVTPDPKPTRVKVPKYEESGSGDVASYLDLFEAVMTRNGEPEESWPLMLRTAVLGTKLAASVCIEDFTKYADIKRELLLAFGATPATVWRELLEVKQQPKETFRQYCLRTHRLAARWLKLALGQTEEERPTAEEIMAVLTQQVVLGSISSGLIGIFVAELWTGLKDGKLCGCWHHLSGVLWLQWQGWAVSKAEEFRDEVHSTCNGGDSGEPKQPQCKAAA